MRAPWIFVSYLGRKCLYLFLEIFYLLALFIYKFHRRSSNEQSSWQIELPFSEKNPELILCSLWTFLLTLVHSSLFVILKANYEMIFGGLINQEQIAKIYKILITARSDLLDELWVQKSFCRPAEDQSTCCSYQL